MSDEDWGPLFEDPVPHNRTDTSIEAAGRRQPRYGKQTLAVLRVVRDRAGESFTHSELCDLCLDDEGRPTLRQSMCGVCNTLVKREYLAIVGSKEERHGAKQHLYCWTGKVFDEPEVM